MKVLCLPSEHALAAPLEPLARGAAARLDLAEHLDELEICLDDLAGDERVWLALGRAPGRPECRRAVIYCHPDDFLKDSLALAGGSMSSLPWQMRPIPPEPGLDAADLSQRKAERFLFHQILMVRDLCDKTVDPASIPPDLSEAFQEAWSVTVDGRLKRSMLPGYSQAERRRRFFRVFSRGGILLPQHWQVFHTLWEWDRLDQQSLQGLLERLPRPRGSALRGIG